ncbi:MAG TPA: hypothetical protein VFX96_05465 [Pyrinomonadaceae bacterium]|nr:hypothetical protein [Pyrinomonadaceae bacterium]
MAVVKKRNQQTETRLLLESDEPVELPPAEVEDSAVVLQFEQFRQYIPELLEALRAGTLAEPVPVMMDGSTFVIHGTTRSFWVKLWHSTDEHARVERVQVISCLPSTRGLQVIVDDPDAYDDDDFDDEEFAEDGELEDDEFDDEDDSEDDAVRADATSSDDEDLDDEEDNVRPADSTR